MAHAHSSARATVYPPAVWRHLADAAKCDADFVADLLEHAELDNDADAEIRAELAQLATQLYDLVIDRGERLVALGRLVPQAQCEHEALALAGLAWSDTGLPESFALRGPWLPKELSEARKLLVWLMAHPTSLPQAKPSEIWPARRRCPLPQCGDAGWAR
jgi:hypothetical protein